MDSGFAKQLEDDREAFNITEFSRFLTHEDTNADGRRRRLPGRARVWSYAGSFTGPVFTGEAITSQVKQAEATRDAELFNSLVNIYKAMGGGWQVVSQGIPDLPSKW